MQSLDHRCSQLDAARKLARGELMDPEAVAAVESHLTSCEACRETFRVEIGDRYPHFESYTIVGMLGRGGFGTVYKALHHWKGRYEALKVLFAETTIREAYFQNEVRLVAQLRHPSIATLYDAQLTGSPMFYTMEYVRGQHLDAYLRDQIVSLERRIAILRAVAEAIGYAHQTGVAHRDLKPQNVLIDEHGQPRIVDFGIGKRLGLIDQRTGQPAAEAQSPGGVLGTYGYIAPEQRDARHVDARADIYALGALLFHVVTGEPAKFATKLAHLRGVLRQRGVARSDDLAAIIARCVATDPESRYASTAALIDDLDRFTSGRAVHARTDASTADRTARVIAFVLRNHPTAVAVALVLVIAAVLSIGSVALGARAASAARARQRPEIAMIAVRPSTIDAVREQRIGGDLPGFAAANRKSWRLLYGRLMERLAAARPRVLAWDMYFPDCQPEYDEALVRGMRAVGAPVIVLADRTDVNGEPVLCPAIRDAAWDWAIQYAQRPGMIRGEIEMPLAMGRGFNPPILSLPVAVLAAVRFPDCIPEAVVDPERLTIRYQHRSLETGAARWRSETDEVRLYAVQAIRDPTPALRAGDQSYQTRIRTDDVLAWGARTTPLEQVLDADDRTLEALLGGKVVLIGRQIPGEDEYSLATGESVFGSQIVAAAIDAVLGQGQLEQREHGWIAFWVVAWCAMGGWIGHVIPTTITRHPGAAVCAIGGVALATLLAGVIGGASFPGQLLFHATVAAAAALGALSVAWIVRVLHRRQMELLPAPLWGEPASGDAPTVVARDAKPS